MVFSFLPHKFHLFSRWYYQLYGTKRHESAVASNFKTSTPNIIRIRSLILEVLCAQGRTRESRLNCSSTGMLRSRPKYGLRNLKCS
jgi:hypothetical protein